VPQDRLRKLTDDNRELAANLKRELTQPPPPRSAAKAATSKSRKGQGSDLGSGRGSEERHSSVPAGGRGTKRGKDNDIEKVGPIVPIDSDCYTNTSFDSPSNGQHNSSRTIDTQVYLQSGQLDPEIPAHGILRQTSQLFPVQSISTYQTLSPHNKGTLLSNSGRGVNSPVRSAADRRSPVVLSLNSPENFAPVSDMNLRAAGQKVRHRLVRRESEVTQTPRHKRKRSSGEFSDGEVEVELAASMSSPKRTSKRHASVVGSSRPGSRNLTPVKETVSVTTEGRNYTSLSGLEIVRDFSPPHDELEYISKDTEHNRQHIFFAPLLGGTTCDEKHKIEEELAREGKIVHVPAFRHPKYDQTLREDRHNENKILFYSDQNPLQRLAIAGVAKEPVHLDPPGSATPYDALQFPERLVEQLSRMDPDTVSGWDIKSLKKIPTNIMSRLSPDVLACFPEAVLNRVPHLRDKCSVDVLEDLKPKSGRLEENFTKLAMLKLQDRQSEIEGNYATYDFSPKVANNSCLPCASIEIKCSRELPRCRACRKFDEECIYDDGRESKYLGLDLSCPITQKHFHIASTTHLNSKKTKDNAPSKYRPAPTFSAQPNVPKVPMRNRTVKRVSLGDVWKLLEDLNPYHADFPGPDFPTLSKFYPGAPIETLTYPYSYEQEETFHLRPSIRITIPDHLKTLLVDDWENVTKSLLLVPLPSKAPANFIIDSYYDEEKTSRRLGSADLDVLEEFCAGMKVYFEKSVGKILLYRFERGQLAEVRRSTHPSIQIPSTTDTSHRSATSGKVANIQNGKAKALATPTVLSTSAACLVLTILPPYKPPISSSHANTFLQSTSPS
jgi:hypothetical protein